MSEALGLLLNLYYFVPHVFPEPHARESPSLQQYLQPQVLRHNFHCAFPQQERSLPGEDQESPPEHLFP